MMEYSTTQNVRKGGPESLGPAVFTVNVLPGEKDDLFSVQLIDKRVSSTATVAITRRSWQDFAQLSLFVRSVAPKFDAPQLPSAKDTPQGNEEHQLRLAYIQTYLCSAISFRPLNRLKELQDFVGYTDYAQREWRHSEERGGTSVQLRHVSSRPQVAPLSPVISEKHCFVAPNSPVDRHYNLPMSNGSNGFKDNSDSLREVEENEDGGSNILKLDYEHMLEECFRIMDVGSAGYITPEDMKEFFFCIDAGGNEIQQLWKDEPYDCRHFIDLVQSVVRRRKCSPTVEEWIDSYWLLQYRKIFMATATLVNWGGGMAEFSSMPVHGFDAFELASLMYVITEAGLRLVSAVEVEEWVDTGRHRRGCALAMEQLSTLLDAFSKAVPFSELWLALLPHHDYKQKILQIVATYAAIADDTLREEMRENIIQLRQAATANERCVNCGLLEKTLQEKLRQLADVEAERASLEVKLRYLGQRHEERLGTLAMLQQDYQHAQELLEEAELREAELNERLENMRRRKPECALAGELPLRSDSNLSSSVLQLMPCGTLAQHALPVDSPLPYSSILLNTTGPVTYALPPEWSLPSEWSVDVFWCETTCSVKNKTERFVCRDAAGRRSCAFLFKNSELCIVTQGGESHIFSLAARCWYRMCCLLDWNEKTFRVTLMECGGYGSGAKKMVSLSCGPFAMVEQQVSGVAVVDIFPRTELLVSYCNFFLRYVR